ncbi:MAG: hypothetical protein RQ842_08135 [Vulcanisaeta sp.]|jgi:hypothetical protein|nr:hypothetical protein [Vulcanisaeta sp.]
MGAPQQDMTNEALYIAGVALLAAIIALIIASIFAWNWYNQYNAQIQDLKARLYGLEERYQSLLAQYEVLESNSTLAMKYHQLQLEYANLLTEIANEESHQLSTFDIAPGGYVIYPIIVPSNCSTTVTITVGSIDGTVDAYITTLSSINKAWSNIETPAMLYRWSGTYINGQATLGPGVYVIVITNPVTSSTTTVYLSVEVTSVDCHV